jgi:hypothetical protein
MKSEAVKRKSKQSHNHAFAVDAKAPVFEFSELRGITSFVEMSVGFCTH